MKTSDEIKKIESIVLYILQKFQDGVDYIKLFKIMYFAQKDFLVTYGKPLCPDTFKARKFGPVPALSDKVIKTVELNNPVAKDLKMFAGAISVEGQLVFGKREADMDFLSVKERLCLDKWIDYCRDKDSMNELSPESHDVAYDTAWASYQDDPQKGEMTLIEIARAGGASEKTISYIREKEIMAEELL